MDAHGYEIRCSKSGVKAKGLCHSHWLSDFPKINGNILVNLFGQYPRKSHLNLMQLIFFKLLSNIQKITCIILVNLFGLYPRKSNANLTQLIFFTLLNRLFVSRVSRIDSDFSPKDAQMKILRKWECDAEDVFQYAKSGCICAIESNKFIKNVLVFENGVIFEANRINMKYINV